MKAFECKDVDVETIVESEVSLLYRYFSYNKEGDCMYSKMVLRQHFRQIAKHSVISVMLD